MSIKLDLACGIQCAEGYEGVDISPCHEGVKHVVDVLSFPWPWPDGSVSALRCSHFAEHVPAAFWTPRRATPSGPGLRTLRGDETNSSVGDISLTQRDHRSVDLLMKFFAECYRVLAPGGTLLVEVPQAHSHRAWQDLTHRRFFVPESFFYLSAKWRREMGLEHGAYGVRCDFSFRIEHTFPDPCSKEVQVLMRTQAGKVILAARDRERWNVTEDLRVTLVKEVANPSAPPAPVVVERPASSLDEQIAEANARIAAEEVAAAASEAKVFSAIAAKVVDASVDDAAAHASIDARARDVARADHEVAGDSSEDPYLFRISRAPGGFVVFDGNMILPGHQPRNPESRAFPDPTPEEIAVPMPTKEGASR